ncbi:MAG TPA: hypothetical protein VK419_14230 [Bryobacteraceae bacterium]|nr:hypothetical protein [Bryobacteraceae bacterium]
MGPLRGSFWALVLYDVAEQIQLDKLREILGSAPPAREPSFRHPVPDYVRFERPPVVEDVEPLAIGPGAQFQTRIKYFDYGVVSVELELPFEAGWDDLVRMSSRWIAAPEVEKRTTELLRARLERVQPAVVEGYASWLSEEYYVIHVVEALDEEGRPLTASAMLSAHRAEIAQIVRGDSGPLAEAERAEALQSSLSYYATDLLVVGWVAALVYDTAEGAIPAIQLLEYANTQLLEFRHYDDVLTRVLENVYKLVEHRGGWFRHWRMARQAGSLNAMRLDVTELTERTDNAIKFLSDMFYARAYRMAAARVGVTDYRNLVERKLRIAGELYEFMVNEFYQARSFLLEAMVVAILVIELIHLFRFGV